MTTHVPTTEEMRKIYTMYRGNGVGFDLWLDGLILRHQRTIAAYIRGEASEHNLTRSAQIATEIAADTIRDYPITY